jgi:regulator of sigma E protease
VEFSYIVASIKGWSYFLLMFAKIGFSLAVMNILPIPVLDGGHAVMILYEMITGRPLPEKVFRVFTMIGFVLLMSLMAFVFFNDISHLLR